MFKRERLLKCANASIKLDKHFLPFFYIKERFYGRFNLGNCRGNSRTIDSIIFNSDDFKYFKNLVV